MRALVSEAGLRTVELDRRARAAGTSAARPTRAPPPPPARGIALDGQRARSARDFEDFDLLLAMDRRTCASCAHSRPARRSARRCGCCASSTRRAREPRSRRARPLLRRPRRLRGSARPRAGGLSRACSTRSAPASCREPAAGARATRAGRRRRHQRGLPRRLADGTEAFVKTRADAAPGEYAAEAAGLEWLAEPGALRTPRVLEVGRALPRARVGRARAPGCRRRGGAGTGPRRDALRRRAAVRRHSRRGRTARFGSLRLPNDPAGDWPTFYAERRLRPLARLARERRLSRRRGSTAVERVCERIAELPDRPSRPRACMAICGRAT